MCGFAGAVVWDERYRVAPDVLARMGAAVAHRGPDGAGFHLSRAQEPITPRTPQVALAFRRLAILDTGVRSMQPFTDGRRWLVFNGEVYNFRQLRAELSTGGRQWHTTGDTEVLLAAYAAWGERCVERLNGMFAFAVWDEQDKTLFLARDRMGQKPLYIRVPGRSAAGYAAAGVVYFASELPAIPQDGRPWEHEFWWGDYLRYGCSAGHTPWIDTVQLGAGNWVRLSGRAEQGPTRYFDAGRMVGERADDATAISRTRSSVLAAVERQLVSDVPLGVFLSGGIDSSIVAAAARRHGPVQTFSVRFNDARYDESAHARAVATHLGTDHHEFTVTPDAAADLPGLAAVFGEPFGDSSALPTHYLARATRDHVKVALSGDGGDELFGGYDRYLAMRLAGRVRHLRFARRIGNRLRGGHPKGVAARAGRFLRSLGGDAADRYDGYMRVFDEPTLRRLAPAAAFLFPLRSEAFAIVELGHPDPVEAALACDRMRYLPDDLLTKVDRASMLHGLEVRSPFLDPDVVTFAAGLTADQLLKGGPKRMLREAFAADLPAWVFRRRKMGFAVPVGDWFRGPLRAMLRDALFSAHAFGRSHFDMAVVQRLVDEHESGLADHAQRLYALLMLELWWDTVRRPA